MSCSINRLSSRVSTTTDTLAWFASSREDPNKLSDFFKLHKNLEQLISFKDGEKPEYDQNNKTLFQDKSSSWNPVNKARRYLVGAFDPSYIDTICADIFQILHNGQKPIRKMIAKGDKSKWIEIQQVFNCIKPIHVDGKINNVVVHNINKLPDRIYKKGEIWTLLKAVMIAQLILPASGARDMSDGFEGLQGTYHKRNPAFYSQLCASSQKWVPLLQKASQNILTAQRTHRTARLKSSAASSPSSSSKSTHSPTSSSTASKPLRKASSKAPSSNPVNSRTQPPKTLTEGLKQLFAGKGDCSSGLVRQNSITGIKKLVALSKVDSTVAGPSQIDELTKKRTEEKMKAFEAEKKKPQFGNLKMLRAARVKEREMVDDEPSDFDESDDGFVIVRTLPKSIELTRSTSATDLPATHINSKMLPRAVSDMYLKEQLEEKFLAMRYDSDESKADWSDEE